MAQIVSRSSFAGNGPEKAGNRIPGSSLDVEDFIDTGLELEIRDRPARGEIDNGDAAFQLFRLPRDGHSAKSSRFTNLG